MDVPRLSDYAQVATACDRSDSLSRSMDFNILFEDSAPSTSRKVEEASEACTHMYLRALRRLCTANDSVEKKVRDVVREVVDSSSFSKEQRDGLTESVFNALSSAGFVVHKAVSPGNFQLLCYRHAYLVVTVEDGPTPVTLLVDPLFREEFEVVRPSTQYQRLLQSMPESFVGTPQRLVAIIDLMSAQMEASFAHVGMCIPPWRSRNSLLSKWELQFGSTAERGGVWTGQPAPLPQLPPLGSIRSGSSKAQFLSLKPEKAITKGKVGAVAPQLRAAQPLMRVF